jgi:coenzyme Q-binding protein COQ10
MFSFKEEKILSYNNIDLKNIIMDVEKYPEFLPWCEKVKIIKKYEDGFEADLTILYKKIRKSYISKTNLEENENYIKINTDSSAGLFKNLHSCWKLEKISDNKTLIHFQIYFELSSAFLTKILGIFFKNANKKMVKSFENRLKILK